MSSCVSIVLVEDNSQQVPIVRYTATADTAFNHFVQIELECHSYIVFIVLWTMQTQKGSNLKTMLHTVNATKLFGVVGTKESFCQNSLKKMLFLLTFIMSKPLVGYWACI